MQGLEIVKGLILSHLKLHLVVVNFINVDSELPHTHLHCHSFPPLPFLHPISSFIPIYILVLTNWHYLSFHFVIVNHFESFYILLHRIINSFNIEKHIMPWFIVGNWSARSILCTLLTKNIDIKICSFMVLDSTSLEMSTQCKFRHVFKMFLPSSMCICCMEFTLISS